MTGRPSSQKGLHESLGDQGITRLWHFVRSKNLPFPLEEVRQTCLNLNYHTCSVLKPRFYRPTQEHLVKATSAWERVSVDFKGPIVTSPRGNRFLFVVVDEYSRFPFAFACKDTSASSVVKCLSTLFSLFGFPSYVHRDQGTAFLSRELKDYLHSLGIATSHSAPYHSTGNSQCECFNQTIWKTISLMIKGRNLGLHHWEEVLPEAMHLVRTLLSTATNTTPHERFLPFPRRSMLGCSLPTWLITLNTVLLKIFVRNKS